MQAWVPIDIKKMFVDVLNTFEKKDPESFLIQEPINMDMWGWPELTMEWWEEQTPSSLVEQVAKWGITSWIM